MNAQKKILIVDDDTDFVESTRMILERGDYEVSAAYSGRECMDRVRSSEPDVILLDMMMETWSEGSNVAKRLHGSPDLKDIPIILVSAVNLCSPLAVIPLEEALNVDAYMVKPIKADGLLEEIRRVLRSAKRRSHSPAPQAER